jgi:predicted nucleic acid-binding protein
MELHELAPAQHKAVLGVAIDAGVSVYGAGYMWLARSLNLPLATFDRKLAAAAPACGVKILDISSL